jgi:hypothetical protein
MSSTLPFVPVFPRTIDAAMRMLGSVPDQTPDQKWKALSTAYRAAAKFEGGKFIATFCAHAYALTKG